MSSSKSLFDVHCHIIESPESLHKFAELKTQSVALMSSKVEDFPLVEQMHHKYPTRTVPCFGIHPWYATCTLREHPDWLDTLRAHLLQNPKSCVGEIGMDRAAKDLHTGHVYSWDDQMQVFSAQWQLAVDLQRPVSMHAVHVAGFLLDFFRHLATLDASQWPPRIMLHSFNGSTELRRQLLRLKGVHTRLYFSFSTTIQRQKAHFFKDWLTLTPPAQILLESDVHTCENVDAAMEDIYHEVATHLDTGTADQCFHNASTFFETAARVP